MIFWQALNSRKLFGLFVARVKSNSLPIIPMTRSLFAVEKKGGEKFANKGVIYLGNSTFPKFPLQVCWKIGH